MIPTALRCLALLLLSAAASGEVEVDAVDESGLAARAGIAAGDIIEAFEVRRPGRTAILPVADPLAFYALQAVEGWRRPVRLHLQGRTEPLELSSGDWRIAVRPRLSPAEVQRLDALRERLSAGAQDVAEAALQAWRDSLMDSGRLRLAAWLSAAFGEALILAGDEDSAVTYFEAPLGARTNELPPEDRVTLLERQGVLAGSQRDLARRRAALESAIDLQETLGDDYRLAKLLVHVTSARGLAGDYPGAIEAANRAAELIERSAPESLVAGLALTNLSTVLQIQGDDALATQVIERAIALYARVAAPVSERAGALMTRGIMAYRRGELSLAEAYYTESLELARSVPDARAVEARALNNLSLVVRDRGNLRYARELLVDALVINQELDPGSLSLQRNLNNLGHLEMLLGDLDSAEQRLEAGRDYFERRSPDATELGNTYSGLAGIAAARGDRDLAERHFVESETVMRRIAPGSMVLADVLMSHARLALDEEAIERAVSLLAEAEVIRAEKAPDSVEFAGTDILAGRIARLQAAPDAALRRLENAIRILNRDASDSAELADAWYETFLVHRSAGDAAAAREAIDTAIDVLDRQRRWLPTGDDAQRHFSDRFRHIYEAAVDLAVEAGDAAAALVAIERYRAKSLMAMLTARDLFANLPRELAAERAELARRHRELRQHAAVAEGPQRAELAAELRKITLERAALDDRLRSRLDETWQAAPPPAVSALTSALDDAEVAILYFALPESLVTIVAEAGTSPVATRMNLSRTELRERVRRYRYLISRGADDGGTQQPLVELGSALHEVLLGPAQQRLEPGRRLLIVPDAELYALPFAALVTDAAPEPRYLIEERALSSVQSLTLHAELKDRRPSTASIDLVAVADSGGAPHGDFRAAGSRSALPGARREVDYLRHLYAGRRAHFLSGAGASEAEVIDASRHARLLHFAVHAGPDPEEPLDAWLEIADGRELLQAWEIIENMDLPASLVALSACETGAGQLVDGEGMISLARAFHTAGARNVVATLWRVPDESTAVLMHEFHTRLLDGAGVGDALRRAQLALLGGPTSVPALPDDGALDRLRRWTGRSSRIDARHPFYWAAFQVIGPAERLP